MNRPILNRTFEHPDDGFYQIEVKGYHPSQNGGKKIVQVIDDKAIQSIADQFNNDAQNGTLRHGNEMLIDREHFKYDQDKDTIAYGWMCSAQARPDGIYAQIRWTGTGQTAVDGGDYRFFSTEYDPADLEKVSPDDVPKSVRDEYPGYTFVRPLRLDGLSLTNMNNNQGQKPITNRSRTASRVEPAFPTCQEANVIMNRAKALKKQYPQIGLASLVELAQKCESNAIMNRAVALRQTMPTLSLPSAILMAQRGNSSVIMNRALSIQKQTSGMKLSMAVGIAQRERSSGIMNRALELKSQVSNLSLATAVIMAQREFQSPSLRNRDAGGPSDADWKAANNQADEVLDYIEKADEKSNDVGTQEWFKNAPAHLKLTAFINAIKRLTAGGGMSVADAFQKLKETQPEFWTQAMLNFPEFKSCYQNHVG